MAKRIRRGGFVAIIAAAVAVACAVVFSAVSEKAEAAFPGKNGKIAYANYGGKTGIYMINPNGGGRAKVTRGDEPSYSPNGKRIAFAASDGHDAEIYTINVGGGGKTKVTNNNTDDGSPSYSPDGKKIAYVGYEGNDPETDTDTEIYTIKVGGGASFQVTHNDTFDFSPSYSPDGKKIAYDSYDGHDGEIYTINPDGTDKFNVTDNNKEDYDPDYSPDGNKIAYTGYKRFGSSDDEDFDHEIYTINVGGGNKSQVTDTKYYASDPSWGSRP